ncbi:MAG TPA: 3-dehydroquinate synthase [Syntrophobacteraceae bacterium]|nr:3-dehydroquinate synthase [Syntrophobacteraceae bacterium]
MEINLCIPAIPARVSPIVIETGLAAALGQHLKRVAQGRELFWVWDARVWELWQRRVACLNWPGLTSERLLLFDATEVNKRLAKVEELARQLVRAGADRMSFLVAVGGGVTGDVAGFLASIFMRGIPHVHLPTTLLAQVDSSVGGKTGVDLPEGKNLLGTFQQAQAVYIDPQFLETLSDEQFTQGMAEVIKMAMLGDGDLWSYLETNSSRILNREATPLEHIIAASCRLKAQVVEADERESGLRRILNLGHTVGHALERLSDYRILHGNAVAMGMLAATRLAVCLGLVADGVFGRLVALLEVYGLPTRIVGDYSPEAIVEALKTDKKQLAGKLHFIVPTDIGSVVQRHDLDLAALNEVLDDLRDR